MQKALQKSIKSKMENGKAMFDSEIIDSTELVARFIDNMKRSNIESGNQILQAWRSIIESIKPNSRNSKNAANFGVNLASHSRIVDFKNGVILIEADHSSWLQMLQLHQRYILGSLQRRFPELKISTLAFKLHGSNVGLSVSYEESLKIAMAKQEKRIDEEKRILEEKGFIKNPDTKDVPDLPPELKALFDDMRKKMSQDMSTNN